MKKKGSLSVPGWDGGSNPSLHLSFFFDIRGEI